MNLERDRYLDQPDRKRVAGFIAPGSPAGRLIVPRILDELAAERRDDTAQTPFQREDLNGEFDRRFSFRPVQADVPIVIERRSVRPALDRDLAAVASTIAFTIDSPARCRWKQRILVSPVRLTVRDDSALRTDRRICGTCAAVMPGPSSSTASSRRPDQAAQRDGCRARAR